MLLVSKSRFIFLKVCRSDRNLTTKGRHITEDVAMPLSQADPPSAPVAAPVAAPVIAPLCDAPAGAAPEPSPPAAAVEIQHHQARESEC